MQETFVVCNNVEHKGRYLGMQPGRMSDLENDRTRSQGAEI